MPRCVGGGCGAPAARTRRRRRAPWCSCAVVVRRGTSGRRAGGGGLGGDKAASGRGSGPSSGPLRRSARCCAHSCSTLTRPHRRSFSPTTASRPRGACGAPRLGLWGPQGRGAAVERGLRDEVRLGLARTRPATSSRTRRATSAGASCPRRSTRACGRRRASSASTRRTSRAWRTYSKTTPSTRQRARAARAARLDAALALNREAAGPRRHGAREAALGRGRLRSVRAPAAGAVLRKLYDRDVGRRGDALLAVAVDLFETDAAADAVAVTVSRADAAEFRRRHP